MTKAPRFSTLGFAALSQALSSGTNFALMALLARERNLEAFGAIAASYSLLLFVVGAVRPMASEIFLVGGNQKRLSRSDLLRAGVLGILCFPILGIHLALTSANGHSGSLLLAVALPAVMITETARVFSLTQGRAGLAASVDVAWALVMAASVLSGASVLNGWTWGAYAAAGIAFIPSKPNSGHNGMRLRESIGYGRHLALETAIAGVNGHLLYVALAIPMSQSDYGALRAALVIFSALAPLTKLVSLLGAAQIRRDPSRAWAWVWGVAGVLLSAVLAWSALFKLVPMVWIATVFGQDVAAASSALLPFAVVYFAIGAPVVSLHSYVRVSPRPGDLVRGRLLQATATLASVFVALAISTSPGTVLMGLAVGNGLGLANWIRLARRSKARSSHDY